MSYLKETTYNGLTVAQNERRQWGVVDQKGNIVVPFGKYDWIDGFDQGLARVNKWILTDKVSFLKTKYWGVINEKGEEVLPLEYEEIWNFLGKNRYSTKAVKDGVQSTVYFHDLNPELPKRSGGQSRYSDDDGGYYEDPNDGLYFDIDQCYDYEGNFDFERLEDAIMDGEYVPEDW